MANAKIMMADTINRFAKDYEQMVKAAEFLKEIGTNEQIADELKAAAEQARKEADLVQDELAAAKAAVKKAKDSAAAIITDANDKADGIVSDAGQNGLSIVAGAKAEAAAIIDSAKLEASRANADVTANRSRIINEINNGQDRLDALNVEFKTRLTEVEALEARLLKAQASIAKLLG